MIDSFFFRAIYNNGRVAGFYCYCHRAVFSIGSLQHLEGPSTASGGLGCSCGCWGGGCVGCSALKDEGCGAAEAGDFAFMGWPDLRRAAGEGQVGCLLLDHRAKTMPCRGEVACYQNDA